MVKFTYLSILGLFIVLTSSLLFAQPVPREEPAVCYFSGPGNRLVAWSAPDQDGYGIFADRFQNEILVRGNFRVNTHTQSNQQAPKVMCAEDGTSMITWVSSGQDGDGKGVYGQRLNSNGQPSGTEFRVSGKSTSDQAAVDICRGPKNSGFIAVWNDRDRSNKDTATIRGQRFAANGKKIGREIQISKTSIHRTSPPKSCCLPNGNIIVFWRENERSGKLKQRIVGQRLNSQGRKIGEEFKILTETRGMKYFDIIGCDESNPKIAESDSEKASPVRRIINIP